MRRTIPFLVSVALLAGCAVAMAEFGFEGADSDDDDTVSRAEWAQFLDDVDAFARYDDNDDQALSPEEYREAVDYRIESDAYFRGFDRDRSGTLSSTEFTDGVFRTFDRDNNGWLNEGEFEGAVQSLSMEM